MLIAWSLLQFSKGAAQSWNKKWSKAQSCVQLLASHVLCALLVCIHTTCIPVSEWTLRRNRWDDDDDDAHDIIHAFVFRREQRFHGLLPSDGSQGFKKPVQARDVFLSNRHLKRNSVPHRYNRQLSSCFGGLCNAVNIYSREYNVF